MQLSDGKTISSYLLDEAVEILNNNVSVAPFAKWVNRAVESAQCV